MREYMRWAGISQGEIDDAVGEGCVPDIIGINHYATSERWLDERLDRYPAHTHGGNQRHRYADVEAVRGRAEGAAGPAALLMEAWHRYGLPIAVTEAHLGCTREQQLRWLHEVWEGAHVARAQGADVQAVTAWAALGTRDWSSLVTRLDGNYEPGLFDIRAPQPRPTALARMVCELAAKGAYEHPVLGDPGWWRCPERIAFPVDGPAKRTVPPARDGSTASRVRPLLVTGAAGTLGSAFVNLCRERGLACVGMTRHGLDIADRDAVERALHATGAWAVVNGAGYVRVDEAERDRATNHRGNVLGPATLAAACAERGIQLLTFSSDLVFDGEKRSPYVEGDCTRPLGAYGERKVASERRVMAVLPSALVVRTSWFFGPWDGWNFVSAALRSIAEGRRVELPDDQIVSPTYVPDLVHASLDLLIDGERGIWHLANQGATTPADFARRAARAVGLDDGLLLGRPLHELRFAAWRPLQTVLESERGSIMPPLEHALSRYSTATQSEYNGADSYVRAAR
jgi:dTDP-4-dehydrorhamnose reductase